MPWINISMRLKQLLEAPVRHISAENPYVPRSITPTEFIDWCEKHARSYLGLAKKYPIFRGFKGSPPDLGIMNTNRMDRVSANTKNIYTVWMDNHPAWKDYPKRSKSIICSLSEARAGSYAYESATMLIIPADINRIGICPGEDLWESFRKIEDEYGDLGGFADTMHEVLTDDKKHSSAAIQSSYSSLVDALKSITIETEVARKAHVAPLLKQYDCKSLYEFFEVMLDPKDNNFGVMTAASMNEGGFNEVWVQGVSATISTDYFNSNKQNQEMLNFVEKYDLGNLL